MIASEAGLFFGRRTMKGTDERRSGTAAKRTIITMALLVFCLALAIPLFAQDDQRALHQAAQVGTWEAIDSQGIELRDASNRVISRADLARGLRAGIERQRHQAADLSSLPGLKAFLGYLDRLGLGSALRDGVVPLAALVCAIVPRSVRLPKVQAAAAAFLTRVLETGSDFILTTLQLTYTPGRLIFVPLLC